MSDEDAARKTGPVEFQLNDVWVADVGSVRHDSMPCHSRTDVVVRRQCC